jgi:hypothetical protein
MVIHLIGVSEIAGLAFVYPCFISVHPWLDFGIWVDLNAGDREMI